MDTVFARRMATVQRSFIREILKVTERPEIISFAGGLPNPDVFPVAQIAATAAKVLGQDGQRALQYSTTEGHLPLREYISARYRKRFNLIIPPDEILITSGSQQGLDLIAKVFLDPKDTVVLEKPGYLGSIQAFSLFEPVFKQVPLEENGIDTTQLAAVLEGERVKLVYAVPSFQNPSGISYSLEKRREVARLLTAQRAVFVEDDPYGELRFMGTSLPPVRTFMGDHGLLLGTFSKIVAPGLRLGWICAPKPVMDKLIVAKQAADLHSNILAQLIVCEHLAAFDLDAYLETVRKLYRTQRDLMIALMEKNFPSEVRFTRPEGGMFIWVTLPEHCSAVELLELALRDNVAFVPGNAFYTDGTGGNTLRLNFSNCSEEKIEKGIARLAQIIKQYLAQKRRG
jgi:2-aminoadipate transaminase